MSNAITEMPDKKRIEIGRVIHRCNTLCEEINMIFFLPSQKYASPFRYTASNPATLLEFIVITNDKESANRFQMDWIMHNTTKEAHTEYTINLLIMSEREFLQEFDREEEFREMMVTAVIVYDVDAGFVMLSEPRFSG